MNKISLFIIAAVVVAGAAFYFYQYRPDARLRTACAESVIPAVSVDTVLNKAAGTVEARWNDPQTGEDRMIILPYEPETGFAGCSDSAKRLLQNVASTDTAASGQNPPNSAEGAPPGSIHNLPLPEGVAAVRAHAAQKAGVNTGDVLVVSAYERDWSDGCLGLGGPAESCLQAIVPGYEVTVMVEGEEQVYRADLTGSSIRREK